MPEKAKVLGALQVKRHSHPGKGGNVIYAIGGVDGLQLQVTPTNARSWLLRMIVAGKRRSMGRGSFPAVSLAQARDAVRETRTLVRGGLNPVSSKAELQVVGRRESASRALFRMLPSWCMSRIGPKPPFNQNHPMTAVPDKVDIRSSAPKGRIRPIPAIQ